MSEEDVEGFPDRDYSQSFSVELTWAEWNRVHSLLCHGIDKKEADGWPEEDLEYDRELRPKLACEIGQASPGNGAKDWPDSMKEAWDEVVEEMIRDD